MFLSFFSQHSNPTASKQDHKKPQRITPHSKGRSSATILPPELWLETIQLAARATDGSIFRKLRLVDRLFNALCCPYSFHTVCIHGMRHMQRLLEALRSTLPANRIIRHFFISGKVSTRVYYGASRLSPDDIADRLDPLSLISLIKDYVAPTVFNLGICLPVNISEGSVAKIHQFRDRRLELQLWSIDFPVLQSLLISPGSEFLSIPFSRIDYPTQWPFVHTLSSLYVDLSDTSHKDFHFDSYPGKMLKKKYPSIKRLCLFLYLTEQTMASNVEYISKIYNGSQASSQADQNSPGLIHPLELSTLELRIEPQRLYDDPQLLRALSKRRDAGYQDYSPSQSKGSFMTMRNGLNALKLPGWKPWIIT